jgi:hypothetical protein
MARGYLQIPVEQGVGRTLVLPLYEPVSKAVYVNKLLTCSISQPSTLFDNVQNMTSILAATAGGTMTYDQACEALYALHLPPSMDSAAFEALEAIWANSSARLFQKASADFG